MLKQRIITALILLPVALAGFFLLEGQWFALFIGAVITLEPDAVAHWLSVRKLPADTPMSEVIRDERMLADVQRAVDYANEAVSRAESIRAFRLVEGEFSEENGMLTPSLKVKRRAVMTAYGREIEELYAKA